MEFSLTQEIFTGNALGQNENLMIFILLGLVALAVIFAILLLVVYIRFRRLKNKKKYDQDEQQIEEYVIDLKNRGYSKQEIKDYLKSSNIEIDDKLLTEAYNLQ